MQKIIFDQNKIFRKYTLEIIHDLDVSQLNHVPKKLNNSIIWNVGHLLISQQMLTYGLSGLELKAPKHWIKLFKIGSIGNIKVENAEIQQIKSQLVPLIEQTELDYTNGLFKTFKPFFTGYGAKITNIDEALVFNNYHEGNHIGHILTMKKLL